MRIDQRAIKSITISSGVAPAAHTTARAAARAVAMLRSPSLWIESSDPEHGRIGRDRTEQVRLIS